MRALALLMLMMRIAHADDLADITAAAPGCIAERAHCIAIQLHVAVDDGGPVVTPAWVAGQLAAADRHFAPLDLSFALAGVDALPASAVHLVTRKDRDAVAKGRLAGTAIHVFLVGQLDDVDEPGQIAYGVTWHTGDHKYLIVSAQALDRTLAHETGHYFGLPHSTYPISIMNKSDRKEPPLDQRTFADEEIAAMRPVVRRMLRDRSLAEIK